MLMMSIVAWAFARIPRESFVGEFDVGVREGVLASSSARGIITAICLLVIAIRVRTHFTWSAATFAWAMSVVQVAYHIAEFEMLPFLATLAIKTTLSPATWGEYYLTYRVYQTHKQRSVGELT
jgi:hypothetical protein